MNELRFYSTDEDPAVRGFRTITATVPKIHHYAAHWWGPGHVIGFEETFVHQIDELLSAFEEDRRPNPNFYDGLRCQEVLEAIERSAQEKCWAKVPEER
jgi:predicted dehydrogenase